MHIRDMGAEGWLWQLLDVLGGDIVTAEEVELSSPGIHFGYGGPAQGAPATPGKKKQKKEAPPVKGWHLRPNQRQEFSMNGNYPHY